MQGNPFKLPYQAFDELFIPKEIKMAFAATVSASEARKFSIGVFNAEIHTYTAISGDTSGTITSKNLSAVKHCLMDGKILHTAAPTFSNNVVTLAFADPGASVFGTIILLGY